MSRRGPQLPLDLRDPPRHGGRRHGAGRKPGPNPRLLHRPRDAFARPVPAHVTLRLLPKLLSLRTVPVVREIEATFANGRERLDFRLVHYSLQGNHAHLIVEARDPDALGRGMMAIGSRLARAVNRVMGRSGRVLADRYHVRLLPTPKEVRNAIRYVLLNARHHVAKAQAASLKRVWRLDPASSSKWFDGWRSDVVTDADRADPLRSRSPVARARTWLLAVGWRRHGLLHPADVPG
jgi:REP element-mobilizing transposase RayT